MTPEEAYDEICNLGRHHALIFSAAGGVVTIVHPQTQKEEGVYEHIQWVHGLGKQPKTLEQELAAESEWHDPLDSWADAAPVTGSMPAAAHQMDLLGE